VNKLRRMRQSRILTQNKLSALTGVSQGEISNIERNLDKPSQKQAWALANFFGIKIKCLFPESFKNPYVGHGWRGKVYKGMNLEMHRRRKERRLSFERLGEIAGVGKWIVYALERGFTKHTRLDRKRAVAAFLGLDDDVDFYRVFPEELARAQRPPAVPSKGHRITPEQRTKMLAGLRRPEVQEKIRVRARETSLAGWETPGRRERNSERMRRWWADPEWKAKTLAAMQAGRC